MQLSVIILTYNESLNLPKCLASLKSLDAEIFVVDSGSSDETVEIANKANCHVSYHPFENQAKQLNWALQNLPIKTPWIMRIDADECVTPELATELKQVLPKTSTQITGYQVKRRVFFMGRWIRHGGYYPTWLLRVWRNGLGTCEQLWMDEHIVLSEGETAKLKHDIIDENQKGLSFWTDKHNRYSERELKQLLTQEITLQQDTLLETDANSQAKQRRWVKKNLYGRSPLFLRAFIYFLLRYLIGLGFLDGMEGLIFHFLQGFWYRFLVDAKIYEMERNQKVSIILPKLS
ncbi:glycosyltransferase family 2 protein [Brunnivagina elsteri]|uniref:Glycosyl transferase n=1 Tax=Brunnivagina elsteri CCALA 953 TaxID=987040 RepID=A0A2A2TH84_9CYAN|nr:glycosyltransferase family 2 protein [Calothrix elsteri]PAX53167.1 glycosyl transferase [Calothrix elsteri CCALA 953]